MIFNVSDMCAEWTPPPPPEPTFRTRAWALMRAEIGTDRMRLVDVTALAAVMLLSLLVVMVLGIRQWGVIGFFLAYLATRWTRTHVPSSGRL